jgi:aryl-alcohol dehydrogenase-like predicted oxidoreductase
MLRTQQTQARTMASGLLTGRMTRDRIARLPDDDWRKRDPRFREPQLSRNLDLVERLTTVAGRHDTTPGAVAIAWTLRNPAVDRAIVGFRRPGRPHPHCRNDRAHPGRHRRNRSAEGMR